MSRRVKIRVPATTANCGPGFDVLGIACTLYNELELELLPTPEIIVKVQGEGENEITSSPDNLVWRSVKRLVDEVKAPYQGAYISMFNRVPLARGMGSSSAAIVAGLYAANLWLGNKLNKEEIFRLATEIEGHPDNVAPAIFGGVTVSVQEERELKYISLKPSMDLKMVVAIPDYQLSTRKARSVLKDTVPFKDAVYNIAQTAMLVAGFAENNPKVLANAFKDKLVQPYREKLIPGMKEAFAAAEKLNALGATISGAGPTLIAYTMENAEEIGSAMVDALARCNVKAEYMILQIDLSGVEEIK